MKIFDYAVDSDGVAILTFDLEGRSMNVLGEEVIRKLDELIDQVVADESVKGAVIASGKPTFCAGADLLDIVDEIDPTADPKDVYEKFVPLQMVYRKLETCGKPFAVAINNTALGGGLELCLAAHHRVAADNPKSRIGLPEVQVGLLPGAGGTQRLPRMIGLEQALPLLVQGKHLDPANAAELGIVDQLVEPGTEVEAARRWILDVGDAEKPFFPNRCVQNSSPVCGSNKRSILMS